MTNREKKWLKIRIVTVLVFFVVLFVALVSRAFQLQVLSSAALKEKATKQHTRALALQPERGMILDRNGKVLSASVPVDSVCADPSRITNPQKVSAKLSSVLGIDRRKIKRMLARNRNFCWIARKINPDQARKIQELKIDGIYFIKEPKRFYTNTVLAAHVLGFVGMDAKGLAGLELKYDRYLRRMPKKILWGKDARGHRFCLEDAPVIDKDNTGYNLLLTIDSRIQHIVELQLKEARERTEAKGGLVVVMEPKTGEILAMACEPGFNPTVFNKYTGAARRNRAITDCFDPGSIFKPFLVAAAVEDGIIAEDDVFDCENGSYHVGDKFIHEAQRKKYKELSVREILKYSSNIGSAKVAEKLGKEKFYRSIVTYGFGAKTGIDLPGEASGIVRKPHRWTDVDLATTAFGQGISVTAIQVITAMSAIANRGMLMKPHIVRALVDKKGRVIEEFTPTSIKRVLSPLTAQRITSMMVGVVGDEDGTGRNAWIADVTVAGKTGTSQKYDVEAGHYSSKKVTASFVGFLPAEEPRMVVLVLLDEPKKMRWGGQAAAPVFKNISEQVLRRLDRTGGPMEFVKHSNDIKIQKVVNVDAPAIERHEDNTEMMPDFRGMTMREALLVAREKDIDLRIIGSGWAVSQKPFPGALIGQQAFCSVLFNSGS